MTRQELYERLLEEAINIREGQYVDSDRLDFLIAELNIIQEEEIKTIWKVQHFRDAE